MQLYDAHNHLQDERLLPYEPELWPLLVRESIVRVVVNGTSEADWERVSQIAASHPQVIPSYGYHPWHVAERSEHWQKTLCTYLDQRPAAIGEIGLDRWIKDFDLPLQEEVFTWQWLLAVQRGLPVTVHCLKAWGRLRELLTQLPLLSRGFLLHSYGGPVEMVPEFARLGAYFSISGYFAQDRKSRQRDTFRQVPSDRLLIETDAPDMALPSGRVRYPLPPGQTEAINHPANLGAVYAFVAELLGQPLPSLAEQVERNFRRLFELP